MNENQIETFLRDVLRNRIEQCGRTLKCIDLPLWFSMWKFQYLNWTTILLCWNEIDEKKSNDENMYSFKWDRFLEFVHLFVTLGRAALNTPINWMKRLNGTQSLGGTYMHLLFQRLYNGAESQWNVKALHSWRTFFTWITKISNNFYFPATDSFYFNEGLT